MSFNVGTYFRHALVVALALVLFYLLAYKQTQLLERFGFAADSDAQEQIQVGGEQIFTEAELQKYDGKQTNLLYLVILGHVYDVTVGFKHYGPGQSYHMFIGHDATRSFVTGEFDQYTPELSDVSALKETELEQLITWKEFYDKTYQYVGKLVGRYFDALGQGTAYYQHVLDRAAKANEDKDNGLKYPSCNVEWKVEMGTRVWCTNRSGTGQERSWIGLPRKVLEEEPNEMEANGRSVQFCACVPQDVSDRHYVPFPGCEETAESCIVPDQN
uniref:Cytochrome b5 heme-binding domain-containing protein n=1 Tax=Anopheles christyi TaxID=43041 RepID=A0A182KCH0_9DIPT